MGIRLVLHAADAKPLDEPLAYPFQQTRVVIGRGAGADVRIPHRTVSTQHAVVREEGSGHVIEDSDSTNGTFVNGARLVPKRPRKLVEGDRIRVGSYELAFHASPLVGDAMTVERTAELARRLLRSGTGMAGPRLVVLDGRSSGTTLPLHPAPSSVTLGRAESCTLVLDDDDVSHEQLRIERDTEGAWAASLDAANAVLLNARPFERRRLRDGDELTLGAIRLLFEDPAEESLQALADEADQVWTPPPVAAPAATQPPTDPPAAPGPAPTAARKAPAPARTGSDADLLIYGLAALILTLSGVGLYLLMGDR
jgi:pSer/pThr/pTyr-binding forkhead associated (FHA) protein